MNKNTATQRQAKPSERTAPLMRVYKALFNAWGPQYWWPAETDEEMVVGAVLTQNTAWTNVEKAIRNLIQAKALTLRALHEADERVLADWIRPAGYFNVKTRRLRALTTLITERFGGKLSKLFELETQALRAVLLSVHGIGPETADSILLYAARRPVFVVDAYTRRFLERHGWIRAGVSYDDVAELFVSRLPLDRRLFNEYHALIVHLGKHFCRKKRPRCSTCPLRRWLPAGSKGPGVS